VHRGGAEGEAAPPEDRLVRAPPTEGMAPEDLIVQPMAEAEEVRPIDEDISVEVETAVALTPDEGIAPDPSPLNTDDILALADQISSGATPMTALEDNAVVPPVVALDGAPALQIIPASVPGVSSSLRPSVRPAGLRPPVAAPAAATASEIPVDNSAIAAAVAMATEIPVSTIDPPAGSKLVQLGAFPSPEGAAAAWMTLQSRFGDYMAGKGQLIQEASSGGRTFYRLRAMGFDDLADARRFCAALSAGNADCIPVVVR